MNNIFYSKNASPLKHNMGESEHSAYKQLFRHIGTIPKTITINNKIINNKFQDSSSYMERKKTLAIGNHSYNNVVKYTSYDPVNTYHTKRRVISAGTVSPKKKNIIS